MASNFVYKYVFKGEIIYIGKTDRPIKYRLKQHGVSGDNIDKSAWDEINRSDIYYAEMANSAMSEVYESELIRRYKPKYNKAKMGEWTGIPLPEPVWIPYNEASVDAIDRLERENALLSAQLDQARAELEEAYGDFDYKCAHCDVRRRFNELQTHSVQDVDESNNGGLTFDEVVRMHMDGADVSYFSVAVNPDGTINCLKYLFSDSFGYLKFSFQQHGTTPACGNVILRGRDDAHYHSQLMRCWENRGSNLYFKSDDLKGSISQRMIDFLELQERKDV